MRGPNCYGNAQKATDGKLCLTVSRQAHGVRTVLQIPHVPSATCTGWLLREEENACLWSIPPQKPTCFGGAPRATSGRPRQIAFARVVGARTARRVSLREFAESISSNFSESRSPKRDLRGSG